MQIPFAIIFAIEKMKTCFSKIRVQMNFEDKLSVLENGKNNHSSHVHVVEVQEFSVKNDIMESKFKVAQEYLSQEIQKSLK